MQSDMLLTSTISCKYRIAAGSLNKLYNSENGNTIFLEDFNKFGHFTSEVK